MDGERRAGIVALLEDSEAIEGSSRICEVCAEVTGMTGAGIMLMSGDMPRGSVCTSNEVAARIEQLQYDLGEGPCVDAYRTDTPVLEPDLMNPEQPRWIGFARPALDAGVRSIFGFPLQVGAVRLGALNLYRDYPSVLTDDEHATSLVMADVAAQAVLLLQADAPPGSLGAIGDRADFQYVVHQATGMVAAQLEIGVSHALIRLRAYAFGHGQALSDVARDVITRHLRFDDRSGEKDASP